MTHGHMKARVDPLELDRFYRQELGQSYKKSGHELLTLLDYKSHGFSDADLKKSYHINFPYWGGLLAKKNEWTLEEIKHAMEEAYCGNIGVEYMHIMDRDQCNWIRDKIELRQYEFRPTKQEKLTLLDRIFWSDEFSSFLTDKYG
jgi:2-oxoglutarate dehydrogenase E1 component